MEQGRHSGSLSSDLRELLLWAGGRLEVRPTPYSPGVVQARSPLDLSERTILYTFRSGPAPCASRTQAGSGEARSR